MSAVGALVVDLQAFVPLAHVYGLAQLQATLRHDAYAERVLVNSDLTVMVSAAHDSASSSKRPRRR
jgi:hypothetical protein